MPPADAMLVDCPNCGNSERISGWDGDQDLACTMCGKVLRRGRREAAAPASADLPLPRPIGMGDRLVRVHGVLDPTLLDVVEPDEPPAHPSTDPGRTPTGPPSPRPGPEPVEHPKTPSPAWNEWDQPQRRETPDQPSGRPGRDKRRRRKKLRAAGASRVEARPTRRVPWWVFTGLTAVGCIALVAAITRVVSTLSSNSSRWSLETASPPPPTQEWMRSAAIVQAANAFVAARTVEERLALVRDPERVRPLIESFRPLVGVGDLRSLMPFGDGSAGRLTYRTFMATYEDNRARLVCVIDSDDPKVDWEAYSRQGSATDTELREGTATEAEVRVLVSPSNYYNYSFRDERAWVALELANSDWQAPLTGYIRRGSRTAGKLAVMMLADKVSGPKRCILRVASEGESGRHSQVVVRKFVAAGWVRGDLDSEDEPDPQSPVPTE